MIGLLAKRRARDRTQSVIIVHENDLAGVLLDLGLPDTDGLDVCRSPRARSAVPIIMITARREQADRIAGLELDADDNLAKPFGVRELIARIRAATRRARAPAHASAAPAEAPENHQPASGAQTLGAFALNRRTR
ncbi:response regulator [Streptomyces sp. B21-083]|uniref:response regulator n=1 Tax=Streptomyces sp. B21-083 TaxID=3039410 RepID=UPI003FA73DA8